ANGTSQNYTPGTELADGILYRRKVTSGANVGYTNTVKVYTPPNVRQGSEFWMAFSRNYNATAPPVYLRFTSDRNVTVTLEFLDNAAANQTINVTAGTVYTHTLTAAQRTASYNYYSSTITTNKSIHIVATDSVQVAACNYGNTTPDATTIYPAQDLGQEYYALGYRTEGGGWAPYAFDNFLVIATQDNTKVYQNSIGGTLLATLSKGQVYNHYAANLIDLTGIHVVADKPVAFFTGTSLIYVPISTYAGGGGDQLFQQLYSVDKWGTRFFVPRNYGNKARIRVLASENGTTLTIPGLSTPPTTAATMKASTALTGPITTEPGQGVTSGGQSSLSINAGQFVEIDMGSAVPGCYIQSNKPVMVGAYLPGMNYAYVANQVDASMTYVSPMEQSVHSVTASAFTIGASGTKYHCLLIVTPTATKASTTISVNGGAPAAISATWVDNASAGMSFCVYTINTTSYYKITNNAGIVVYGQGFENGGGYYYVVGSAARNLKATLMVNSLSYEEMQGRVYYRYNGVDPTIAFRCDYSATPSSISWTLDGVAQPAQNNQAAWQTTLSDGDHIVVMTITIGGVTFVQSAWFKVRDFIP
ncbi:MAG: IgGFc-binding protein, partial [Bacteroidales bacterium]|nr:IgGFc-binding protein [Bacteroidales bacterium]